MHRIKIIVFFIAVLGSYLTFAQETPLAVISYASTQDILVIRNNKKVVFDDPIGLILYAGDQVQTGRGVTAEIQFSKPAGILKMTENTTIVIERLKTDATINIRLIYGRIRTKMSKLAGNESFSITSAQAVAGVRGTDFGFEVLTPRVALNPMPVTKIYCFEGEVFVTAYINISSSNAENLETVPKEFTIKNNEMVVVERKDSRTIATLQKLEYGLTEFWNTQTFMSSIESSSQSAEKEEPEEYLPQLTFTQDTENQEPVQEDVNVLVVNDEVFKNRVLATSRLKDAGILGSILLSAAGLTLKGLGWYFSSTGATDQAAPLNVAGDILFISTIPFLVFAIVIQP